MSKPMTEEVLEISKCSANDLIGHDDPAAKSVRKLLRICCLEIRRCWAEIEKLRKDAE